MPPTTTRRRRFWWAATALFAARPALGFLSPYQSPLHSSLPSFRQFATTVSSTNDHVTNNTTETTAIQAVEVIQTVVVPKKFVPFPFQYHQELNLQIDSLTNQGWGVGRVELEHDNNDDDDNDNDVPPNDEEPKWVVMVPHVLVGETVRVRIFRNMKNYSEAELVQVLEASPDRVTPRCSLAGTCGGCQYQHMSIEAQREWKQRHVQEGLLQQQIEGYETADKLVVEPTAGTDEIFEYRSKLTPHYQAPVEKVVELEDEESSQSIIYHLEAVGFQRSSNRKLVDVPECPIATPAINAKYQQTRQLLYEQSKEGLLNSNTRKKKRRRGRKKSGGALGATLLFRQADDDDDGQPVVITDHNEYMTTTVKGIKFRYQAGNFFQNNNYVLPLMVDAVVDAATRPVNDDDPSSKPSFLIDCYCGSGLFALSAAQHFELCVGIEVNEKAIDEASENAQSNGISNCQFMAASAEAIFKTPPKITVEGYQDLQVQDLNRKKTVVVLDPPRKGCSPEFLQQLYEFSPQRIVYMSCGPATQARDAKGIVEVGGYRIVSIQPFDLFPQTKHIESLMVFEKE